LRVVISWPLALSKRRAGDCPKKVGGRPPPHMSSFNIPWLRPDKLAGRI